MSIAWYTDIVQKVQLFDRQAGPWQVEKLCEIVHALSCARGHLPQTITPGEDREGLACYEDDNAQEIYVAYRNTCKLAIDLTLHPSHYSDTATALVFQAGGWAMRSHFVDLLRPLWEPDHEEGRERRRRIVEGLREEKDQ